MSSIRLTIAFSLTYPSLPISTVHFVIYFDNLDDIFRCRHSSVFDSFVLNLLFQLRSDVLYVSRYSFIYVLLHSVQCYLRLPISTVHFDIYFHNLQMTLFVVDSSASSFVFNFLFQLPFPTYVSQYIVLFTLVMLAIVCSIYLRGRRKSNNL